MESQAKETIRSHIAQQWPSHRITEEQWTKGPVSHVMPDLRILAAVPRKSGEPCIYVTCGASDIDVGATYGIEFFLYSRSFELRHVELLSMVAYMHRVPEHHFNVGHTMKIGWPWEDASACDRLLVSLPYSPGKRFEILHLPNGGHVRFLWLVPITPEEQAFGRREGLEALESRFEEAGIDFMDPKRASVAS
jgi:hypothetical protein